VHTTSRRIRRALFPALLVLASATEAAAQAPARVTYPTSAGPILGTARPFTWTAAPGAATYRLRVAAGASGCFICFENDLFDSGFISGTSVPMPGMLPRGQWLRTILYTEFPDGTFFYTESQFSIAATDVVFTQPADTANVGLRTTFAWTPIAPNASFDLRIGTSPGLSDITAVGGGGSSVQHVVLPADRQLYARLSWTVEGQPFSRDLEFRTRKPPSSIEFGVDVNASSRKDDALLYDAATGAFEFWWGSIGGFAPGPAGQWSPGWNISLGDFDGNGLTDAFYYNPSTGRALKALNQGGTGAFAYVAFAWSAGWTVTVADLNGDRRSDVFVYNAATGRWFRCISRPDNSFAFTNTGTWSPNWSIYPGDFNGDGRADLFLYNGTGDANGGRWFRVLSNPDESLTYIEGDVRWSRDWAITAGDFDGDRVTDLWLYRAAAGHWYRVSFASGIASYASGLWSPGWTIFRADFDPDGREDLFLYNQSTGRWFGVMVRTDGSNRYIGGWTLPANAQPAVLDFTGDHRSDVLLYDPADGQWRLYPYFADGLDLSLLPTTGSFGSGLTLIQPFGG
jgi:hypothetical protein